MASLAIVRVEPNRSCPLKSVFPVASFAKIQLFPRLALISTTIAPVIATSTGSVFADGEADSTAEELSEGETDGVGFTLIRSTVTVFEFEITI